MPKGIRRLLGIGIICTLLGLLGLAVTAGRQDLDGLVRWLFIPLYGIGALALLGGGIWWLVVWTKRRD